MSEAKNSEEENKRNVIKECYEDGFAEINGRKYMFGEINHKTRLKIFGFAQSISVQLSSGNLSFIGTDGYFTIEDLIFSNMTYDHDSLNKIKDKQFEDFGEDYILLITTAFRVFSYPFMKGTN